MFSVRRKREASSNVSRRKRREALGTSSISRGANEDELSIRRISRVRQKWRVRRALNASWRRSRCTASSRARARARGTRRGTKEIEAGPRESLLSAATSRSEVSPPVPRLGPRCVRSYLREDLLFGKSFSRCQPAARENRTDGALPGATPSSSSSSFFHLRPPHRLRLRLSALRSPPRLCLSLSFRPRPRMLFIRVSTFDGRPSSSFPSRKDDRRDGSSRRSAIKPYRRNNRASASVFRTRTEKNKRSARRS